MATEDMTRKNEEFEEVLRPDREGRIDSKMLQMLIQGAIGTTVNQVCFNKSDIFHYFIALY